jgi:hypothetical protein
MTYRRTLASISGLIIGFWPAGLLLGGLDFYGSRGALVLGFAAGLAGAAAPERSPWLAGVAGGLAAAFGFHLLVVGVEWRFIAFAFERALPFLGCALTGALARAVVDRMRSRKHLVPGH